MVRHLGKSPAAARAHTALGTRVLGPHLVHADLLPVVEALQRGVAPDARVLAGLRGGGAVHLADHHPGVASEGAAQLLPHRCQALAVAAPPGRECAGRGRESAGVDVGPDCSAKRPNVRGVELDHVHLPVVALHREESQTRKVEGCRTGTHGSGPGLGGVRPHGALRPPQGDGQDAGGQQHGGDATHGDGRGVDKWSAEAGRSDMSEVEVVPFAQSITALSPWMAACPERSWSGSCSLRRRVSRRRRTGAITRETHR